MCFSTPTGDSMNHKQCTVCAYALVLNFSLSGMQTTARPLTTMALGLVRKAIPCALAYYLYDSTFHEGQKTREAIETTKQSLSDLYESGTSKLETLMGKQHNETIRLLKKQHRQNIQQQQKTQNKLQENQDILQYLQHENAALKEKCIALTESQKRIEKKIHAEPQTQEK